MMVVAGLMVAVALAALTLAITAHAATGIDTRHYTIRTAEETGPFP